MHMPGNNQYKLKFLKQGSIKYDYLLHSSADDKPGLIFLKQELALRIALALGISLISVAVILLIWIPIFPYKIKTSVGLKRESNNIFYCLAKDANNQVQYHYW